MADRSLSQKIMQLFNPETPSQQFMRETMFEKPIQAPNIATWPKSWIHVHFKSYSRVESIPLDKKFPHSTASTSKLQQTLLDRESCREMTQEPLTFQQISELLLYSVGIKSKPTDTWDGSKRMYPSGGARYPVEIYCIILNASGLAPGLYHYHFQTHSLEILEQKDFSAEIQECYGDPWILKASMIVAMTGMFGRSEVKYHSRGLRHILIESGHIGQNFYLNATSLGLGCCGQGGHVEARLNRLLDIDGWSESVLNTIAIGTTSKKIKT